MRQSRMSHQLCTETITKRLLLKVANKSETKYLAGERWEALSKLENNMKEKQSQEIWRKEWIKT